MTCSLRCIHGVSLLSLILLLSSACLSSNSDIVRMKLFNEQDLDNWRQVGAANWQVSEREITVSATAGDGMLVSRDSYTDFKLSLEFWVDEQVNSGIFIRCADTDEFTPLNCYEMNIWDKHPNQDFRTGSIVTLVSPPLAQVNSINKWNTYEITAKGNKLQVAVNGIVTARLQDDKHSSGYIALQCANNGKVRFKNIFLEVLE